LWVVCAHADIVNAGALSYDTFIPAGNGSPGINAFDLANLTGGFSLPPDFPVEDALTFGSAMLTLTLSDLSEQVFALGKIGPGFLLDQNGNPIVQVAGNQAFDSAEFTATLAPVTFALWDGTSFTADSSLIDVMLLPSSGQTLTVDVDQTTIGLSGTVLTTIPEPSAGNLLLLVVFGLGWGIYARRGLQATSQERR
jgi:hypothetical protein